jgi:hypothetical protein
MGYGNDSFFLGPLINKQEKWSKRPLAASVKFGSSPLLDPIPTLKAKYARKWENERSSTCHSVGLSDQNLYKGKL